MTNGQWLVVAMAIVLVAILGYSLWISSRKTRLERRLNDLRREGH